MAFIKGYLSVMHPLSLRGGGVLQYEAMRGKCTDIEIHRQLNIIINQQESQVMKINRWEDHGHGMTQLKCNRYLIDNVGKELG